MFHVLNRGNGGQRLFENPNCYADFVGLLEDSRSRTDMRVLAYCLMPNHWHLLLWPQTDQALARFTHRLTLTHTQRWHVQHNTVGRGHLYQARYKSFAVNDDDHLTTVCRYIERNPLRAGLVERAEDWAWSSLRQRIGRTLQDEISLTALPLLLPAHWCELVNRPQTTAEVKALRDSLATGRPFGDQEWRRSAARRLGLRPDPGRAGRPRLPKGRSEITQPAATRD